MYKNNTQVLRSVLQFEQENYTAATVKLTRTCGLQCGSGVSVFGGWRDVVEMVVRYVCILMLVLEVAKKPRSILSACHGRMQVYIIDDRACSRKRRGSEKISSVNRVSIPKNKLRENEISCTVCIIIGISFATSAIFVSNSAS